MITSRHIRKNKEGLAGRFKIIGQVGVGVIIGSIMMWHPDIVIKEMGEDGLWMHLDQQKRQYHF